MDRMVKCLMNEKCVWIYGWAFDEMQRSETTSHGLKILWSAKR